jgi:hypothetical protein
MTFRDLAIIIIIICLVIMIFALGHLAWGW